MDILDMASEFAGLNQPQRLMKESTESDSLLTTIGKDPRRGMKDLAIFEFQFDGKKFVIGYNHKIDKFYGSIGIDGVFNSTLSFEKPAQAEKLSTIFKKYTNGEKFKVPMTIINMIKKDNPEIWDYKGA